MHIVVEFDLKNFSRRVAQRVKAIILEESAIVFDNKELVVDDHFKIIPRKKKGSAPTIFVKYDMKNNRLLRGILIIVHMLESRLEMDVIRWENVNKIHLSPKKKKK